MEKLLLRRKHLVQLAAVLAFGSALPGEPVHAQSRNSKSIATITVTAAPIGNLRELQRLTIQGQKFLAVSASIPVPYGDLNLMQQAGVSELDRRVKVAARMACEQLDTAYPPYIYAVIGGDDCVKVAADNGLAEAERVVAAKRRR